MTVVVLLTQFWFPILAQGQTLPGPVYVPERLPPVSPDYQRADQIPKTFNTPAPKVPLSTDNYVIDPVTGKTTKAGSTPTGAIEAGDIKVTVPTAKEVQDTMIPNTLIRAQQKPINVRGGTAAEQSYIRPSDGVTNESMVMPNGTVKINVTDFIPGSFTDDTMWDTLSGNPDNIKAAGRQIRNNLNQIGCRSTAFVQLPTANGSYTPTPLLTIMPQSVTLIPVSAANPTTPTSETRLIDGKTYLVQRTDNSPEAYTGGTLLLSFPTLGKSATIYSMVRPATPTVPGFELALRNTPFSVPADGTYFTYPAPVGVDYKTPLMVNLSTPASNPAGYTTFGRPADGFRWVGSFNYAGGVAQLLGIAVIMQVNYTGTVPTGGCPADPSSNPYQGIFLATCGPADPPTAPMWGVCDMVQNPKTAPQTAMKAFNNSVFQPHPSRNNADVTAIFSSSESLADDSNPAYAEIFAGCTFSNTNPGSTSTFIHKPDIYHCQNLRQKAFEPNGCDGTRLFAFSPLPEGPNGYHSIYTTSVSIIDNWPRPAPTCTNVANDVLTGAWTDPFNDVGTWQCTPPKTYPTCNQPTDTLTGDWIDYAAGTNNFLCVPQSVDPTCAAGTQLNGGWIDRVAGTNNFMCVEVWGCPDDLTHLDVFSGGWIDWTAGTNNFLCTKPDTTTYVPRFPAPPATYAPAIPAQGSSYVPTLPLRPQPYVPVYQTWTYTKVVAPYTGPAQPPDGSIPVVQPGGSRTIGPDAQGRFFTYSSFQLVDAPESVFPWNVRYVLTNPNDGGSVEPGTLVSVGDAGNLWSTTISTNVVNSASWTLVADIYKVTQNIISFPQPGCDKYVAMMADGFCQPQMLPAPESRPDFTCTEDHNVGGLTDLNTTPNGVFVVPTDGSPAYGGIAKLLVPWGPKETAVNNDTRGGPPYVPVPDSCWKAHGGPMTCAFPTGKLECYYDVTGKQICPETSTQGLAANFGDPNFLDNCNMRTGPPKPAEQIPLFSNGKCQMVSTPKTTCAPNALGLYSNTCYVYDILYDCGGEIEIKNPAGATPPLVQSCGATPIRCMGTQCYNPPNESNGDFNETMSKASAVDAMRRDMKCANGDEMTVDANGSTPATCEVAVFVGEPMWCKVPIGNEIGLSPNCCALSDEAAAGVDPAVYLRAIQLGYEITQLPAVQALLAQAAQATGMQSAYSGLVNTFEKMSTEVSGAANATVEFLKNAFTMNQSAAFEVADWSYELGEAATRALPDITGQLTNLLSVFQQAMYQAAYDVLYAAFGPEITAMFISGAAKTTAVVIDSVGKETAIEVGGFSAGPILSFMMYAYMAYAILQVIGNIYFACEQVELTLGIQRKVGNCHDIGGFCKTKLFLVGCVEWHNVACCFKNPLSRIIHEQVRKMLHPFEEYKGYGSPENPNCNGLTMDEMSDPRVNWSAIDLSDWVKRMQDAGLIATSASDAEQKYGLGANTNQTVLGMKPPADSNPVDYVTNTTNTLGTRTTQMTTRRVALSNEPVCYSDPSMLPWYKTDKPVEPVDVITYVSGNGGRVTYTCGEGCVEIILGKDLFHAFGGDENGNNCSAAGLEAHQNLMVNVLRGDLVTAAYITEATWDDHAQFNINGNPVYTSPSFYSSVDLKQTWCLTSDTLPPPPRGGADPVSCSWPDPINNPAGLPPPGLDVTPHFQQTGVINTDSIVKVWGCGHGYAKVRVYYNQPATTNQSGDCITPPPRVTTSGGAAAMSCTLSPSNLSPLAGQGITLSNICTPTPSSRNWSASAGCSIPVGAATATVVEGAARTCTYTANATDGNVSAQASVTINWRDPGSMVCVISANNTMPILGAMVNMSVSCNGGTATSYAWTNCSSTTATCSATSPTAGPKTYSVLVNGSITAAITVNFVVSGATPPACLASANITNPVLGVDNPILTASCTNSPNSYTWTNCASPGYTCMPVSPGSAGPITYSVTASNASGASTPASVTVYWTNPQSPECTLSTSLAAPTIGVNQPVLTATCSQSPTSYTWTNCASSGSSCNPSAPGGPGQVTYQVTASNALGSSAPATVIVDWQPAGGSTGCAAFNEVKIIDEQFPPNGSGGATWLTTYNNIFSNASPGWGINDLVVIPIIGLNDQLYRIRMSSEGNTINRAVSVSTTMCAFSGPGVVMSDYANDFLISFTSTGYGEAFQLTPGVTYYLNIDNRNCTSSQCDATFGLQNPTP